MFFIYQKFQLASWVENVTNMSSLFQLDSKLEHLNLLNWDTSKVTNMPGVFAGARSLINLDLSS
jgi:surface protein